MSHEKLTARMFLTENEQATRVRADDPSGTCDRLGPEQLSSDVDVLLDEIMRLRMVIMIAAKQGEQGERFTRAHAVDLLGLGRERGYALFDLGFAKSSVCEAEVRGENVAPSRTASAEKPWTCAACCAGDHGSCRSSLFMGGSHCACDKVGH